MIQVVIGLGIALALSLAGNAWQYHQHTVQAERLGAVEQLSRDVKNAAESCKVSVDELRKSGIARDRRLGAALDGIAPRVAELQKDAIESLRAKPDDPKDLCGSAQRYLKREIEKARGTPAPKPTGEKP